MDESPLLRKSAAGNRDTGKLLCRAQGSPNITFTWRRQTGELAGGSKYQVQHRMIDPLTWESQFNVLDINPADYGIYECAARNTMGVSYQQVTLDMPSRPDAPTEVTVVSTASDSVAIRWVPGFGGGSHQMFRIKYYATASLSLYPEGRVHFVDPIDDSSFEIRGLKASTKYKFAIQSLNDIGESEYTTPLEAVTEVGKNQPLVDGLTDTSSQSVPIIVTISVGVCATLLLLLSVVLITCLVHKRRVKGASTSRSFSSDTSGKPSVQDGFTGSQGTSCYNDTMSEETMSYISERSGSFISPAERASGVPNVHGMMVSLQHFLISILFLIDPNVQWHEGKLALPSPIIKLSRFRHCKNPSVSFPISVLLLTGRRLPPARCQHLPNGAHWGNLQRGAGQGDWVQFAQPPAFKKHDRLCHGAGGH